MTRLERLQQQIAANGAASTTDDLVVVDRLGVETLIACFVDSKAKNETLYGVVGE